MTDTRKVIVNGTEYEVELEGEGTQWKATVGGQTFEIQMPEATVAAKPRRSGGRKKKKSGTVSANIPGKVVTVEVEEGQTVQPGEELCILEAMKMENVLKCESKGVVKKIHAEQGANLSVDAIIIEFEKDE